MATATTTSTSLSIDPGTPGRFIFVSHIHTHKCTAYAASPSFAAASSDAAAFNVARLSFVKIETSCEMMTMNA